MPDQRSRPAGNRFIPNVPVVTHLRQRAMFYDDLIRDRVVLVGFMSIANDAIYPVTRNLVQVQRRLGARLGRDVHLYSITVDPAHDTAEALEGFAQRHGAQPGWSFLTGNAESINAILGAFFAHRGEPPEAEEVHGAHAGHGGRLHDCSMGLMRYGNDAVGLWGSVASLAVPVQIVDRLSWVEHRPRRAAGTPLQRGGPKPLQWLANTSPNSSPRS